MGTRDALMEARLRAARDKEAVVEGGATNVTVQPATPRGMNTAGLAAETAERTAATCFGSMVEIRRETPLITPLASAMQSGLHKVLGMVLPSDEMPTVQDVGVNYVKRFIEVDSMYLYIKAGPQSSTNEAVIYRRDLDAAYDAEADMIVVRHRKQERDPRRLPPLRTMHFRGATEADHIEWVRRLTGHVVPEIEDSYVMVYRTLSMPGVHYPPIDEHGNIPGEAVAYPPSTATGGAGGDAAAVAPPTAAPAPIPQATGGATGAPAPSAPPPPGQGPYGAPAQGPYGVDPNAAAPTQPPGADNPPAYVYDDSRKSPGSDLPPPYFG